MFPVSFLDDISNNFPNLKRTRIKRYNIYMSGNQFRVPNGEKKINFKKAFSFYSRLIVIPGTP